MLQCIVCARFILPTMNGMSAIPKAGAAYINRIIDKRLCNTQKISRARGTL